MLNQNFNKTKIPYKFSFEQDNSVWDTPAAQGREWDWSKLLNQGLGLGREQLGFASNLEGARQNNILSLLQQFTPGQRMANVDSFRRRAKGRAKSDARQNSMLLESRGINPAGAELDAANNAALATNQFDSQMNSPEGILQAFLGTQQAIDTGQSVPILDFLMQLAGPASMTDQIAAGRQDEGSGLAGLLGMIAGAGTSGGGTVAGDIFGKIFGGKKK